MRSFEKEEFEKKYRENSTATACRLFGISRSRLYALLKKHKIPLKGQPKKIRIID